MHQKYMKDQGYVKKVSAIHIYLYIYIYMYSLSSFHYMFQLLGAR